STCSSVVYTIARSRSFVLSQRRFIFSPVRRIQIGQFGAAILGSLLALVGATLSPVGAEVLLDVLEGATLPGVVGRVVLCHLSPTRGNRRAGDDLDRSHLSLLHRRGLGAVNLAENGEHVRLGLGLDPAATLSSHHPPSTSWVVGSHNERSGLAHVFVLRLRFGGRLDPLDKTLDLRDQLLLELMNAAVSRAHLPDRKSTRLNSSHVKISYAAFCPRPPRPTPFPYTTLFRSSAVTTHQAPVGSSVATTSAAGLHMSSSFGSGSGVGLTPLTRRWTSGTSSFLN